MKLSSEISTKIDTFIEVLEAKWSMKTVNKASKQAF